MIVVTEEISKIASQLLSEKVKKINEIALGIAGIIVAIAVLLIVRSIYVVKQWQKVAVIRFGKIIKIVDTGLHFRVPFIDSIQRVDLRMQTVDLRGQSAITKDNISVGIDAVVFMKIEDAEKVILRIKDYADAVSKYAQTSIRDVIGRYSLDDLLESREEIAKSLKYVIDELSKDWGIDITRAELQDISLPGDMKRAFAAQAEAERESRAVLIKANAELEAPKMLSDAAANMKDPNAMQLRILSTINDVSKDQSNTIIMALPLETLRTADIQGIASLAAIKTKFEKG
ncbi:MAG: SPFH domain-containing protein [Candidatus Bathyarchaeota archaeon]|nr:SPFH domain-containing protein [Candidatus Bathyarchaeota archaeon]